MMEALGAIAAEPGEVPDCNCSFFKFYFISFLFLLFSLFFSFPHTQTHPTHTTSTWPCVHKAQSAERNCFVGWNS